MSDERDETRSFSPFDDATWADDEGPGRGRSPDRFRRSSGTPGERTGSHPRTSPDETAPVPPSTVDDATRPQPSTVDDPDRLPPAGYVTPADDGTRVQSWGGDPPPVPSAGGDATQVQPAGGAYPAADEDATRVQSRTPGDRTQPLAGADAPTVVGGPAGRRPVDATSVLPPATENPAWSGRAEVRAPQPVETTYQQETDWPGGPPPQQRDRWWMPIVVGIIVLILLAVLGWGIYLIVQNAAKNDNAPGPAVTTSAPPAPSKAATTQTTEPSSAPTTTTPTPTASTTNPTDDAVAIPALRGLTVADAKAALHGVGINSTRVIYLPSTAEPGTVIDSDPEEGQEVPPDTTVTLVVAAPGTATTPPVTATTAGG